MDKEPYTSGGITRHISSELQNNIDVIAAKLPRKEANPSDLNDDQKRWLVVGICLHSVISPALRKCVDSILTLCYNELIHNYKIDTQIYPNHLETDPQTGVYLNYEAVNNNKAKYGKQNAKYGKQNAKYDYTIKNAVDLSKLFLETNMTHYTGFDESCDSSALVGLILNIAKFDPVIKSDADEVRKIIRNPWAHCDFSEWDSAKYSNSFQLMKKLVKDLKLNLYEEKLTIEEMEKWEINGQRFLSGTTHDLKLLNEFRQETHDLAEYAILVAVGTVNEFVRITNELKKFEIIFNQIAQLDKDTKKGFSEIDTKFSTQDKTLKKHGTQIGELEEDVSKCACRDFHTVDIERWKDQDIMFVETPFVKTISQILESKQSVLLVGEPGIGKSMLMHHLVLQLHNKNAYSIIPCFEIKDIQYHFRKDMRQMFVFDDICGRFTVSLSDIEYLQKTEDSLKQMLVKGKSKIVATCRLDIYNDEKFHKLCSLFKPDIFNVSVEYSKEDKLTICTKYLNKTNIQLLRDQPEPFTPLMAYLYSKNENFNLTVFLHGPYDTYRIEWEKLQSIDPYKYCALLLCVIFNGIIKESLFDIYNENMNIHKKVLKNLFEVCGVNRGTSSCTIKKVLDGFIGTYLRKTRHEYKVIHDQMFDFMCCYFGNNDELVRCILRHADITVFNERTQLESINKPYGKFTIIISKKFEHDYFERIKNDLQQGKLTHCFFNAQMKHANYRSLFLNVLKSLDNDYFIDNCILKENIISSCNRGYYDIVEYFISKNIDLNEGYSSTKPLPAACDSEIEMLVQFLLDKECDINQVYDGWFETPLAATCGSEIKKFEQFLLNEGYTKIKQFDGFFVTPLIAACNSENEKLVQLLLDKGCDMNQVDDMFDSPLTAACNSGNKKIVQLLLDRGCNINRVDRMCDTPLTVACNSGNEMIVQLLLDKGCDINQVDCNGETPLIVACKRRNEKIVQLLLDKGCGINKVDYMLKTPLTAACNSGNEMIVQLLIDNGGDVNQVDFMFETPLTAACISGNEKIVQLLLDKGCDKYHGDSMFETPLKAACKKGNTKTVPLLLDKGCDNNQGDSMTKTHLRAACKSGSQVIEQLLIDKGCAVDQVTDKDETLLTAACKKGDENIVPLHVDKGSDVNKIDGMKDTSLRTAYKSGSQKIIQLLIDKKCAVDQVPGRSDTLLTAACKGGNVKIVQLFIDKGCDVNRGNDTGQTPMTVACFSGNEEIVQLLIAKGGDVNRVNGISETPLIVACGRVNEMIVQLLLDKGCDINQIDGMKNTPLTAACSKGNEKIAKLLIEKGSDINQVDGKGQTPLTAARRIGNTYIAQLLIDKGCDVIDCKIDD